ncbi:hypothetical protein M9H77_23385 [Catharanthus roseus]|uniref:Uncharacterized protein n=1 Tax=Catharanthus roseus TaxID=4058 RepID=A0ACC0ASR5_CATRO|nr:hypothetical protein M9H77_23385 [Catharanthus roseus]
MIHRFRFEAVDRTFKDILKFTENYLANRAFGRKFSNWIKILGHFLIENSNLALKQLVNEIYPQLSMKYKELSYLKEHAILAPKNTDVDSLNLTVLSMLAKDTMNPLEYLYLLDFPRLQYHCLLKEGASIILLQNINQPQGLCNGTRLVIVRMGDKALEAEVLTESNVGDFFFIPRISLTPQSIHTPFPLKRG